MSHITVHLLGSPYVEVDGERVNFPYKKAEGLFYYLCIKGSASREEVVQLLWDENTESVGRKNLREAVYQIKKLFGGDILVTEGNHTIRINPDNMPEIDWYKVNENNILDFPEDGIFRHFYIKNSYEFGNWISDMQELYNQMYIECAKNRLQQADAARDVSQIQQYSSLLIKKDPYNEKLYQDTMDLYALSGNYNMALKLYADLQKVLKEDLDVEPSEEVTQLFRRITSIKENRNENQFGQDEQFFGRNEELYALTESIYHFIHGDGQSINYIIQGESGVGKTALLEKAARIAVHDGLLILRTSCYRDESDFFLRPFRDVFREILQHEEKGNLPNLSDHKRYVQQLFNSGLSADDERKSGYITYQMLEQEVLEIFNRITQVRRIILLIDDIQWMDSTSCQLLNRIFLTLGADRLLVLGTCTSYHNQKITEALSPLFHKGWLSILSLSCFTHDETLAILKAMLPDIAQDTTKCDELYTFTSGNAFFLYECISLIKEKGYTLELSQKTAAVIQNRLSSMSEEENQVLNCLSIFPERVCVDDIELLLKMNPLDILEILEKLEIRHLVKEISAGWNIYYTFVHGMFRDYVYERQSNGRKVKFHQLLAEHYEKALSPQNHLNQMPLVIYHYERAKNQLKTYQYKVHYLQEFYTVVQESFPILESDLEHPQELHGITPSSVDMVSLAREITEWNNTSAEALELKMEMYYIIGRHGISVGDYDYALSALENTSALARQLQDRSMLLNCYKQFIFYTIQIEDFPLMKNYLDHAFEYIRPEEEHYMYGVFLRLKGEYLIFIEKYQEAWTALEESIHIFESWEEGGRRHSMNIAACYCYMGDICRCRQEINTAYDYYLTAIDTNTEKLGTNGLGQFYSNAGQVLYNMEHYDESRKYLQKSLEAYQRYGYMWGLERTLAYLTLLELAENKTAQARIWYQQAREISDKIRNPETNRLLQLAAEQLN